MDTAVTAASPPDPITFPECKRAIMPVAEVLQQIGGKWTIFVFTALSHGPLRFGELMRAVDGVSQKMLTATLREMERDGFVTRTVTPSIPPRVDYALTSMGTELREPLRAIAEWAHKNRERVEDARHRFAAREEDARRNAW